MFWVRSITITPLQVCSALSRGPLRGWEFNFQMTSALRPQRPPPCMCPRLCPQPQKHINQTPRLYPHLLARTRSLQLPRSLRASAPNLRAKSPTRPIRQVETDAPTQGRWGCYARGAAGSSIGRNNRITAPTQTIRQCPLGRSINPIEAWPRNSDFQLSMQRAIKLTRSLTLRGRGRESGARS